MTDILIGLASLTPIILAGCLVVSTLDRHGVLRPVERLSLGYGIGTALLTWEMLIFQLSGLSFGLKGILPPMLGVSAVGFLAARRFQPRTEDRRVMSPLLPFHSNPLNGSSSQGSSQRYRVLSSARGFCLWKPTMPFPTGG